MNFIGIIPARYASTRFPGKPLADMKGKPMIQRVYEQARKSLDKVCVATDDPRIADAVIAFGGEAVMTSEKHRSGTDRCYEAYLKCNYPADVIINIQGDEPFIQPAQIDAVKACFRTPDTQIATLAKPYSPEDTFEELFDPNHPKIIFSEKNREAIYFSRSIIPYKRGLHHTAWLRSHQYYRHIGMYAYRADILAEITQLPPSALELAESLEQLRWIENGYKIKVGISTTESMGIDTPADMEKALRLID